MAGTITTAGFKRILNTGLNTYSVTVRAKRANNTIVSDEIVNFGTASNSSISIPSTTLSIPGGETITKLEIFGDNEILWELDQLDYEFTLAGTLTVNITFSIPTVTPFRADGLNFILGNGLRNQSITISYIRTNDGPVSQAASFGTEVDNVIDLASTVVTNIPAGSTVSSFQVSVPSITVIDQNINNITFTNSGTLTLSELKVTLTN